MHCVLILISTFDCFKTTYDAKNQCIHQERALLSLLGCDEILLEALPALHVGVVLVAILGH